MADEERRDRTTGDWMHAIAKATLSAVPVVGGPAGELFGFLVIAPASKRKDQWIRSIEERLVALEAKIPGLIESLSSNDEFVTATLHATQVAMRSHQEEKLTALRNAILNVAAGTAPEVDRQLLFLEWVDAFTPTHFAFLETIARSFTGGQRRPILARLSADREFTDAVVNDLNTRGLLIDHRPYIARNRESSAPLVTRQWDLSALGRQFVAFIEEGRETSVEPHPSAPAR